MPPTCTRRGPLFPFLFPSTRLAHLSRGHCSGKPGRSGLAAPVFYYVFGASFAFARERRGHPEGGSSCGRLGLFFLTPVLDTKGETSNLPWVVYTTPNNKRAARPRTKNRPGKSLQAPLASMTQKNAKPRLLEVALPCAVSPPGGESSFRLQPNTPLTHRSFPHPPPPHSRPPSPNHHVARHQDKRVFAACPGGAAAGGPPRYVLRAAHGTF